MSDEAGLAAARGASPQADVEARACVHELPTLFETHGLGLNATLTDMLHEHFSHRTERRGCGFTQATRHLAALINRPRAESTATIARLFPAWARARGYALASEDGTSPEAAASSLPDGDERALTLQRSLRALIPLLEREESRMLAAIIVDPEHGKYFFKFYGPAKLVAKNEKEFLKMIEGAK